MGTLLANVPNCNIQIDLLPFADVANVCRLSSVVVIDGHIRDLMIKNCPRHVGMANSFEVTSFY